MYKAYTRLSLGVTERILVHLTTDIKANNCVGNHENVSAYQFHCFNSKFPRLK